VKKAALLVVLALAPIIVAPANPTPRGTILDLAGSLSLYRFSTKRMPHVRFLNRELKQQVIDTSARQTVFILLYEFATGTGPYARYFVHNEPFAMKISEGPAVDWLMKTYLDSAALYDSLPTLRDVRFQFSAKVIPLDLSTWGFAIKHNIKPLKSKNLSQFMLGSFNADIIPTKDSTLQVHLWNRTSRKSYFIGIGKRRQRPLPLGTIRQHVSFTIPWHEAVQKASKN
jgi:hypothetical protein